MPGLVPDIHRLLREMQKRRGRPGTSPAMTNVWVQDAASDGPVVPEDCIAAQRGRPAGERLRDGRLSGSTWISFSAPPETTTTAMISLPSR